MPIPGPPYSPEFRAEAVRLLRSSGKTVAELSRELGVSEQTLRRWRRAAADEEGASLTTTGDPSLLQEPGMGGPAPGPSPPRSSPSRRTSLDRENRGRRFALTPRGKDQSVRRLARLAAEAIDIGIVAVTLPARWAANGLRWYADQKDHSPRRASTAPDGDGPAAAE